MINKVAMIFITYFVNSETVIYGDPALGYDYVNYKIQDDCLFIEQWDDDGYEGILGLCI